MFTVLTHNFPKVKGMIADNKCVTNKRMTDFFSPQINKF